MTWHNQNFVANNGNEVMLSTKDTCYLYFKTYFTCQVKLFADFFKRM